MAYKDENGKITIDDVAAGEDIRKIERAQSILQNALQSLRAAQTEGANSKGETAQAIYDKSQELITRFKGLIVIWRKQQIIFAMCLLFIRRRMKCSRRLWQQRKT